MSDRKRTPDLLGLMMSGNNIENNKEIKQENNKGVEQESINNASTINLKEIKQESNKEVKQSDEELKEKATFNLSKQILLELEDEWINIRRSCGGNKRITKTLIVEVALGMALEDFRNREQNGSFYNRLVNHKAIKQD